MAAQAGQGVQTVSSSLFFKSTGYFVDSIRFDLLIDEQHTMENAVTEHAVEDGSTISDHIQVKPRKGSLTGFVTNSPLTPGYNTGEENAWNKDQIERIYNKIQQSQKKDWLSGFVQDISDSYGRLLGQAGGIKFSDADFANLVRQPNRVKTAFEAFEALMKAKKVCTIVTGLRDYVDVTVTKVSTERDKETGGTGKFKVEFQEVPFVTLAEIQLVNTTRPNFKSAEGKQATKPKKVGKTGGKNAGKVVRAVDSTGKEYLLVGGKKIPVTAFSGAKGS
jgi:hypothetical protein